MYRLTSLSLGTVTKITISPLVLLIFSSSVFSDTTYKVDESFENGGWNAESSVGKGATPGLDKNIPPQFLFNQLQGDHSFVLEDKIVRDGKYSAKLVWHHENPESYNGDKNTLENVDRKAMFHGYKTDTVMGAEAWFGFSMYFPSEGTKTEVSDKTNEKKKDGTLKGYDWLFFQIHASADRRLNEHSRNPPFSITMNEDGLHGSWKWDDDELSLTRVGKGTEYYTIPGAKSNYLDRWVDFVVHVKVDYSDEKNGLIELWVDGEKVLNEHNIQFGYNDDNGIYPSWGMYFTGDLSAMKNDHYLYLDAIKMADFPNATYDDVAPKGTPLK